MDPQELKRLMKVDAKSILSGTVEPFGTEYDIVKDALAGMVKVRIANRDIKLPGLVRNMNLIINVLAEFKSKEQRNVMPLAYAKSDDIVIAPLRPQNFGIQSYKKDVTIAAGSYTAEDNIVPQVAGTYTIPDKQIFVITDFVDFAPESPVTAIQVKDVDGESWYPVEVRKELKLSDLHVVELDFPVIADASLDIDALVERTTADTTSAEKVSHELTPFGVWIGFGKDIPKLRTET